MRIADYNINLDTNLMQIFVSGCHKSQTCKNCINEKYKDFNLGPLLLDVLPELIEKIKLLEIDKIHICGGDPFDSDHNSLYVLCRALKNINDSIEVRIYTNYEIDYVKNILDNQNKISKMQLLKYVDYIAYLKEFKIIKYLGGYPIDTCVYNEDLFEKN